MPAVAPTPVAPHSANVQAVEPCRWTRSKVQQFAEEVATAMGYFPGGDLDGVVRRMGGRIVVAGSEVGCSTGCIEVTGQKNFVIYLSPFSSLKRDRFTIAHELGHYVLHSKLGEKPLTVFRDGTGRAEWEANWFAAGFLMPGKDFRNRVAAGHGNASLAVHFGVSEAAVTVRKSTLGI